MEPIIGGAELPPSPTSSDPPPHPAGHHDHNDSAHSHPHQHHHHHHHHRHRTHSTGSQSGGGSVGGLGGEVEEAETAHRILNLLSEIGHSNMVTKLSFSERNFLPCKYCKGQVQIVWSWLCFQTFLFVEKDRDFSCAKKLLELEVATKSYYLSANFLPCKLVFKRVSLLKSEAASSKMNVAMDWCKCYDIPSKVCLWTQVPYCSQHLACFKSE